MPRPKLKSDDEVLEAATVVLKRCGPIEFTLSGVAKEVGLSRAALIQRFTNRDTLLVRMMERGVEQVRHYLNAIPIGAGPQGLWEFLGSVAKIVKLEHAWRRLDGRNDDGFQVAPFP
ncbi:TetR/AcrR family transcriptional regulator, partial [Klebsiella pneumoniae]|uniref:TetR/AcrR family transcriptional regulator n=1 Tax=Klebsiella pneumoniae TaxID=573 RepID=UPI00216652AC